MTDNGYPHHVDSEKAFLASVIKDPTILDQSGVDPVIFFLPAHKTIFNHLAQLYSDNGAIDWILLKESFCQIELEIIGGIQNLNEIFGFVPSPQNWHHYLDTLESDHKRRIAIQACDFIRSKAIDQECCSDLQLLFDRASRSINFLRVAPEISLKEALRTEIESLLSGHIIQKSYTLTGLQGLDEILGGVFAGEMLVVAGETSRGKSALAVQIATHLALDQALKVAIFSFEMDRRSLLQRIISSRAEIRLNAIRYAEITEGDMEKLRNFPDTVPEGRTVVIEDAFSLSIDGIFTRCRRLKSGGQLHAIIVDYLQLVSPANRANSNNRQSEVAEISRNLKLLAGQLGLIVIALSQVNEAGQTRESRAIEHDADIVLKIQDDENSESTTERQIVIRKNRMGARGKKVKVDFYGDYVSFATKA